MGCEWIDYSGSMSFSISCRGIEVEIFSIRIKKIERKGESVERFSTFSSRYFSNRMVIKFLHEALYFVPSSVYFNGDGRDIIRQRRSY